MAKPPSRCFWCSEDPLYIAYHDKEWGVPVYDDQRLFEMLILEGAQAGLSWLTILKRREGYRSAFANFDVEKVARFTPRHVERLMMNEGIIPNRLKIEGTIKNARATLKLHDEAVGMVNDHEDRCFKSPLREARQNNAGSMVVSGSSNQLLPHVVTRCGSTAT